MGKQASIELIKVVADPTRQRIMNILTNNPPQNPADLANTLKLTRPGIEKHLKILRDYQLVEREVESWPSPRYVYMISQSGISFFTQLTELIEGYIEEAQSSIVQYLESIQERFILGKITRTQYEEQLADLERLKRLFED